MSLAVIPFVAYTLLFFSPITAKSMTHITPIPYHFTVSFPITATFAAVLGPLAFSQFPAWSDVFLAGLLYMGMSSRSIVPALLNLPGMYPESSDILALAPRTPTSRLLKAYLKTILANPESRKIFYFLMLNLSYMLIQMLYGVWTNSLGLISDGMRRGRLNFMRI